MNKAIHDALIAYLEKPENTQASVCKATGLSTSQLSQYKKEKYPGDVEALETKIAQFLHLSLQREEMEAAHTEIGFVETSVVKRVCEILNNCHVGCRLGIVTGASGLGKTTGVHKYIEDHSDVIVIYGRPCITQKSLLQELAEKIGVESRGSADNIFRRIAAYLKGSKRMIIIDEAEHFTARVLDIVRRFSDKEWAGIGVAFVGLPRLWHILKSERGDYEYIYNRSRWPGELSSLNDQDVKAFVSAGLPQHISLWKVFAEESMRKSRVLINLIEYSAEVAAMNGIPIDAALIREAAKRVRRQMGGAV